MEETRKGVKVTPQIRDLNLIQAVECLRESGSPLIHLLFEDKRINALYSAVIPTAQLADYIGKGPVGFEFVADVPAQAKTGTRG